VKDSNGIMFLRIWVTRLKEVFNMNFFKSEYWEALLDIFFLELLLFCIQNHSVLKIQQNLRYLYCHAQVSLHRSKIGKKIRINVVSKALHKIDSRQSYQSLDCNKDIPSMSIGMERTNREYDD